MSDIIREALELCIDALDAATTPTTVDKIKIIKLNLLMIKSLVARAAETSARKEQAHDISFPWRAYTTAGGGGGGGGPIPLSCLKTSAGVIDCYGIDEDGCPKEVDVLKRYWREHHKADVSPNTTIITAINPDDQEQHYTATYIPGFMAMIEVLGPDDDTRVNRQSFSSFEAAEKWLAALSGTKGAT